MRYKKLVKLLNNGRGGKLRYVNKQLNAFRHYSFWQCMDTLRDKKLLNNLYRKNLIAPWEK